MARPAHMDKPPPDDMLPSSRVTRRPHRLVPALYNIGLTVGDRLVKPEHFPDVFDPPAP